jgi:AcrR family transcriptional regulator
LEAKTAKELQSEQTRQRILAAAISIFTRKGFYGTSIARLAHTAGLTKGALYHHFKDKEALFFAAIEKIRGDWQKAVVRDVMKAVDAPTRLQVLFENHTRLIKENESLCLIMSSLVAEMEDLSPDLAAEVKKLYADFTEFVARIIQKGQAAGQIRTDIDPRLTALTAVEMLRSACSQLYDRSSDDRQARMATMKQIFLAGLRP